jgi:hypothetical protein
MNQYKNTQMHKWGAMGAWVAYVWSVTLAGLAVHPYQSVRRMVMDKPILLPVTLSPVLGLLVLFFVGRVGSFVFTLGDIGRETMALLLGSILIGLLLWQGLLLTLIVRFLRAKP